MSTHRVAEVLEKIKDFIAQYPPAWKYAVAVQLLSTRACKTPVQAFAEASKLCTLDSSANAEFIVESAHGLDTREPRLMFRFRANGRSVKLLGGLDENGEAYVVETAEGDWRQAVREMHAQLPNVLRHPLGV